MRQVIKVPSPGEPDHGVALDQDELRKLLEGFKGLSLFPIVVAAAFTGARRGEILALRWDDLDVDAKTLRIERSVDDTDKHGLRFKGPKRNAANAPSQSTMTSLRYSLPNVSVTYGW
jgi:integrase